MKYQNKKWQRKRALILKLDGYKDVLEARYGRAMEATMVHHIYPAEEWPEYAFENWNLISLNAATHNRLHVRKTRELTDEGKALMRRTTPGEDWRKNEKEN